MKKREKTYTGNPAKPAQVKATAPERYAVGMRDTRRVAEAKSNAKQRIEQAIVSSRGKPTVGVHIAAGHGGYVNGYFDNTKKSVKDKKKDRVR